MIVSYRQPLKSADIGCASGEPGGGVAVLKQQRLRFIRDWRLGPDGVKCLAISCLDVSHPAGQIESEMGKKLRSWSGRGGVVWCRGSIRSFNRQPCAHALIANTLPSICFSELFFFLMGRMSHL